MVRPGRASSGPTGAQGWRLLGTGPPGPHSTSGPGADSPGLPSPGVGRYDDDVTLEPNEQLEVLLDLAERLERLGIDYMVSGSMALSLFGRPRMTRDVDLVVALSEAQVDPLSAAIQDFEHDPDEIREAARSRRMFNLIHVERVLKFDLIVRKDSPYRREEFSRRRQHRVGPRALWVVSPEDLLLSKLAWGKPSGSEIQLRDVRDLMASAQALDWPYIERWAKVLDVADFLERARERHE